MKICKPSTLIGFLCLAQHASASTPGLEDKSFKPGNVSDMAGMDHFKNIKTAANFGKAAGKIDVCPSGDCTNGQVINLAMSRLEELDTTLNVVSMAENFNKADGVWSALVEHEMGDGIIAMTTSYIATLSVKEKGAVVSKPTFNLTASIFSGNGTTKNGNQTVPVPAGGLKFTVSIAGWLFQADANTLRFAVTLKAKGKGTAPKALDAPVKAKRNGMDAIDRVTMGEGMFMDAPTTAVVDGKDTAITASVEMTGGTVEYVWVFPHFTKTLFYDPVVSSTDESATSTTTTTATTTPSITAPTPTSTTTSAARTFTLSSVIATGILILGCAFF
uniref:DOMON domain-containing protein n=1 Tax=Globisporangium ultimum (strain ATCC 200006 / CBS 805.95 / DAOM BR144) TaxID=431595 RepID=K3WJH9_GLOUD